MTKLQAERREIDAHYTSRLKEAKAEASDSYDRLMSELFNDLDEIDDSIAELRHGRLRDLAERHDIPLALRTTATDMEHGGPWTRSRFSGRWFISEVEAVRLRSAIRQDRKERFEERSRWLPPLVSVLSLVVAILALVLKH